MEHPCVMLVNELDYMLAMWLDYPLVIWKDFLLEIVYLLMVMWWVKLMGFL